MKLKYSQFYIGTIFLGTMLLTAAITLTPAVGNAQLLGMKCSIDFHEDLQKLTKETVGCCKDVLLEVKEKEQKAFKTMCRGLFWLSVTQLEQNPKSAGCNDEISQMIADTILATDELSCNIS